MKINKKIILFVLLAAIASLYSVNFFRNAQTISTTGDLAFHFSRIKGLASVFSGPINFTTFNSYGGGVNYFYPYLTLLPAVFFYWITNNLILSYILYVWVLNICTILLTFYYGKKFLKRVDASFLFSCLYTFYGYRTIDIYHRSAIAEAIALTIIPVVLYYAYELIFEKKKSAVPFAVSMSLLIYTHVISTLMCVVVIGLIIIGHFVSTKTNKEEFLRLVLEMLKSVGLTIVLTAYFWYPMLQQMMHQKINKPGQTDLQDRALSLSDSLIGAMNNDMTTFTMGIIGVVSLILPLIFFKRFNQKEKVIYLSAVASWLLSTNLFPWLILQNTPVQLIQFPWRILGFQVLFGSLILSIVFMKHAAIDKKSARYIAAIILSLFVVSAAAKVTHSRKVQSLSDHVLMNKEKLSYYTTSGTGGLYDYAPLEALKNKEHLEKHEVKIGNKWKNAPYKASDSKIVYTVQESNEQKLTLPVYDYWGTAVKVNGQKANVENSDGLVTVKGLKGANTIEVSSYYPAKMIVALLISLSGYLLLLVRFLINKSSRPKKHLNHSSK